MAQLRFFVALVALVLAGGLLGAAEAPTEGSPSVSAETTVGWRQVDAGMVHTCGIRTSGRLYCWGFDGSGQLGDGGTNTDQPTPVQVAGGRTDWARVSAGDVHTCALRTTGRLYCWGPDYYGELGDGGTNTGQTTPVQVAGGRTDWARVSAGGWHTCALRTTGRLYCWGRDLYGELGDGGTNTDQAMPVQVAGGRTDWAAPAAGFVHTCARRTNGRLHCWGRDYHGQLGDGGTNTDQAMPVQVAGGRTDWAAPAAGASHTCARRTTGRLYCWGSDSNGQLGDGGTDTDQPTPVQVAGGRTDWAKVAAGGYSHTCALRTTGRLYCWGSDSNGQLGDGGTNTSQPTPVEVVL